MDGNFSLAIQSIIGQKPHRIELYKLAMVHSSASIEVKGQKKNNERLEFLGDAILGAVVTDYLFDKYPHREEGQLTNIRSKIVSRKHLNAVGKDLGLDTLIEFNPSRGTQAKSIHGDAFEALVGAIYLDLGYQAAKSFLRNQLLQNLNLEDLSRTLASHKSALLEWGQKNRYQISFKVIKTEGQSHNPLYTVACYRNNEPLGKGQGTTKKKAEEEAARKVFQALNLTYAQV